MVTGKTKNLGVIGYPIVHSLSPEMQNAAIEKANIDYEYIALPVAPDNLSNAVNGLKALEFRGFNVTIPHKTDIMQFLDEIDADAKIIGAVNTVVNDNGKLTGFNTDIIGFVDGLRANNFDVSGKTAVMLGAGGAARAIIWGLIKENAEKIVIGVRTPAKVKPIADYFQQYIKIEVYEWGSMDFRKSLNGASLLINTTPLGMFPNTDTMPPVDFADVNKEALVYDIIYTPEKTKLLSEAEKYGHHTVNGEIMLVGQGAAALKKWTGCEPNTTVMLFALRNALNNK